MLETLGCPVTIIHEDGERVVIGVNVKDIKEKPGGVRVILEEHTNIPTLVPPASKIEVEDFYMNLEK